jgi:hypothetical protein
MNVNDSVVSQDGTLEVTLTGFDPARGKGQIRVEELVQKPGWFYITAKFASGGQSRIDYKTWDVNKASEFEIITSVRNDAVTSLGLVRVETSS